MKTQIKIFGKSQQVNLPVKLTSGKDDKLKEEKTFKLQDRISFRGLDIAVENKKGSVRRGVDNDGEEWETKMFYPYGYIRGTMGVDGDAVDCFVGPNKESDKVFVVHQEDPENGKFDEDKVMLGFDSLDYARAAYLAHYDDQNFLGKITAMNFEEFKKKVFATKKKPGMIKSFGLLLKAFGNQLGFFDSEPKQEVLEGETRTKDGKTYEIRRSKKNPNVRRLFKREQPGDMEGRKRETENTKQKPKLSLFRQQVDLFGQNKEESKNEKPGLQTHPESENKIIDVKLKDKKQKKQKFQTTEDLFSQPEKSARPDKQSKDELIENFGVTHLDSKVRAQRIEINKKVKELLATKKNEEFTPEDKKLLAQYSGKGGTDEVSLNEYYTPDYVAKFQWSMLERLGFKGGTVLEPSCGAGIFLHTAPDNALVTAVEYDETSSRIASILFPQHEVYHMPFEKFNNENFDKEYKASVGNVPFGQRGETSALDPEKAKVYHVHEQYFLDRIIDDLSEGGLASIIVPTGIMDNQLAEYRLELNKKAEFLGAIRMPTGVFKNANAQVTTDIVFFKKRPEAATEAMQELEGAQLSNLYGTMILDAEFVNGTFFSKNPEYVLGTETIGNFGRKIWKGDITPADLEEAGELIKKFETDYSVLGDIGLKYEEEKELHVGDIITRNGRNYQLNENHRWVRLDNIGERLIYLPEERQKILGIKTLAELHELIGDKSRIMELSRDQIKELHIGLGEELDHYTSSNVQKNEMLKRAVVLGSAIKDFQKRMQTGIEKSFSTRDGETYREYEPVSTSDAQREAQQLAMLLEDFKLRYGHPSKDAKLNAQMGKSSENPMLYLVSAFDSEGNLSKLFTDPKSFYNVYHSKMWNVNTYNDTDLLEVIAMLKGNGLSNSAESIKSSYNSGDRYTLNEFKKKLYSQEDVFIDENGDFDNINEVCSGEVYSKLDYWAYRTEENKNKLRSGKLTDEEKELLVAENKKLEEQTLELKRRAEIRTLEDLPVDMSDAATGFFDIKHVNDYLQERLGTSFKGEIIYSKDRNLFTFADGTLNNVYALHIAKGELDKDEKKKYEWAVADHFNREKNHISMVMLDLMNGFSYGTAPDYVQQKAKDIEQRFKTYLSETAENRDAIENKYNREYNNFIQKSYDNSVIEGLSKLDYDKVVATDKQGHPVKVRDQIKGYNYSSVRRMYEQGRGLIAHGVGLGKTVQALLLGALSKETGRANKVTYVVPKSVAGNWNAEIKKWFKPETKVLIIGSHRKEDSKGNAILDAKGREQWVEDNSNEKKVKLSRLVNEDFDFIIMTRDFYGDIRMTPQTTENMVDELVKKFYVSKGDESDKAMEKKREAIKHKLANEFLGNIKKDKFGNIQQTDEIYFENLGIDMLIADEAHSYKNLIESVLYSDIKYLNVKHSQRATDFYFKSKIIRSKNNDKGVYSMTATPISNSPMEAFNMLLPIAEKEFERMGINNVDDFVKKFAEVDAVPTMSAAAKIVKKSVFTKFKNLNLLRKTFFRYADYKTAEMVGAEVHFPKENPNFLYCEQSKDQKKIMKGLKLRLLQHEFKNNDLDKLVTDGFITEKEKKELTDYADVHSQKVKKLAYLGKGDDDPIDFYFNILDDMKKATADLEWYAEKKSPWADPIPKGMDYAVTPKVKQLYDSVITKHKDGAKQLVFATNVNLHNKIKEQLVNSGIPADEILIVNGGTVKSSDSRLKASEDFNNGRYKVVIGNYETMGEGLNFNIGTTDIHHLQPAWNSLAIDQGNGRGIRQGNKLDSVNTYYYLTKGTIDAFFNQKILDKRGFVNSILMGKDDVMENDDGGVSADEIQIALAEDPEQARKLLQRKNEAFTKLMKERKVKENYGKLDNLFTQKTRLARMADKESLAYKSLAEDVEKIKKQLNSSSEFEHKDILTEESRPIVLPQHNAVVKVGSVIEDGQNKAIISNYSHSTGRITIKMFNRYEVKTRVTDLKTFGNSYGNWIKPSGESAEAMFQKLITKDKTTNIEVIEALPDEIYSRYKNVIIENLKDGYSHAVIAKKQDGSYIGTETDYAFEHGYDIILPQETTEYFNIVDKAVKTVDNDYDEENRYYTSQNKAREAAERFFGKNWESKVKYLKQKAKGNATSETDDLEFEEQAA
jgi:hypothetical protein